MIYKWFTVGWGIGGVDFRGRTLTLYALGCSSIVVRDRWERYDLIIQSMSWAQWGPRQRGHVRMREGPTANRRLDVIEVESRAALIGHERPLSQTAGLFWACGCVLDLLVILYGTKTACKKCDQQTLSDAWPIHYCMHTRPSSDRCTVRDLLQSKQSIQCCTSPHLEVPDGTCTLASALLGFFFSGLK